MSRENELTVIVGKKGSGKSTRAREIMRERLRRIISDPQREHRELGVVVRSFEELVEYITPLRHDRYAAVYWGFDIEDLLKVIALPVSGTPEAPPLPGVTIMIDEADREGLRNSDPMFRLINYGRHFNASLVAVARRPKRLHPDLRANMDRLLIGTTYEPADVDYFREYIGDELAEKAKAIGAPVPGEKPTFIEWEG